MAGWQDVERIALALPEVVASTSYGRPAWKVGDTTFVWERPLTGVERRQLGDTAPDGALLGASVADEGVKHALIAAEPDVFLTTPHFDGYAAVLVRLDAIGLDELTEVVTDAWLAKAPVRVRRALATGASPARRPRS